MRALPHWGWVLLEMHVRTWCYYLRSVIAPYYFRAAALLTAHYSLLTTHYSLLTTHCSLHSTYYLPTFPEAVRGSLASAVAVQSALMSLGGHAPRGVSKKGDALRTAVRKMETLLYELSLVDRSGRRPRVVPKVGAYV